MAQDIELNLFRNESNELQSGVSSNNLSRITGSGFGTGSSVVLFGNWMDKVVDSTASISDMIVGGWDTGNYATGLLPKIKEGIGGKTGITLREGGTNASTDNRLTGFVKQFAPFKNFFIGYEMCVPSGRYFPGASSADTLPGISAFKPIWLSDQALDSATKADVVLGSWTGADFNFVGNNCPYNIYMDSIFNFNAWNGFAGYAVAGADPFVNNGEMVSFKTSASGTTIDTVTNVPAFGASATDAQYTHVNFPAWSGNGSQDLAQALFAWVYISTGSDDSVKKRLELVNNLTPSSVTKRRQIPHIEWTDTYIDYDPGLLTSEMVEGMTHICVMNGTSVLASRAI